MPGFMLTYIFLSVVAIVYYIFAMIFFSLALYALNNDKFRLDHIGDLIEDRLKDIQNFMILHSICAGTD